MSNLLRYTYIYGDIDHIKFLDALKDKYKKTYQVKLASNKLKNMFTNQKDFIDFKTICKKDNIEYNHLRKNNRNRKRSYTVLHSYDFGQPYTDCDLLTECPICEQDTFSLLSYHLRGCTMTS